MADESAAVTDGGEAAAETRPDLHPGDGDWRASIADDRVRRFAEKFTSPADAAKTAFEFRQKLSDVVPKPGKNATPEEVAAFRKAIGVPDSPGGYEIELPDDPRPEMQLDEAGEARLAGFLGAMHQAGAPPAAVQAAIDTYFAMVEESLDAVTEAAGRHRAAAEAELTKEWAGDFKRNNELAKRAAHAFGGERFVDFIEKAKVDGVTLGDHPELLRAFARIGRNMNEDGLHMGLSEHETKTTQDRIKDLQKRKLDAHDKGDYEEAQRLDTEQRLIYEQIYGDQPIVGRDMRTL